MFILFMDIEVKYEKIKDYKIRSLGKKGDKQESPSSYSH